MILSKSLFSVLYMNCLKGKFMYDFKCPKRRGRANSEFNKLAEKNDIKKSIIKQIKDEYLDVQEKVFEDFVYSLGFEEEEEEETTHGDFSDSSKQFFCRQDSAFLDSSDLIDGLCPICKSDEDVFQNDLLLS